MPEPFQVREAQPKDRRILQDFHRRLYIEHRDRVVAPENVALVAYRDYERMLAEDLTALMADRSALVLVADSGSTVVGYITGRVRVEPRRVLPRRGVVEDWYVTEASRGAGVGRALLAELERCFLGRGCDVVESGTWAGNHDARRAHEALGFREIRVTYRKPT